MIGLLFALPPFALATIIARREPAHRPIRDALGCSAWYSLVVTVNRGAYPENPSSRAQLFLFALVALASGVAYLRALKSDVSLYGAPLGSILGMFIGASGGWVSWDVATWGPFVTSSAVGVLALWRWWQTSGSVVWAFNAESCNHVQIRERPVLSIAQRIALALLASDIAMLAFVRWPGVQIWQGRCSALVVTAMQGISIIDQAQERRRSLIRRLLDWTEWVSAQWMIENSGGLFARGTVYVWLARFESEGLIESKSLPDGRRLYRLSVKTEST